MKQTNMEIMKLFGRVFSTGGTEKTRSSDSEQEEQRTAETPTALEGEESGPSKPAAAAVLRYSDILQAGFCIQIPERQVSEVPMQLQPISFQIFSIGIDLEPICFCMLEPIGLSCTMCSNRIFIGKRTLFLLTVSRTFTKHHISFIVLQPFMYNVMQQNCVCK